MIVRDIGLVGRGDRIRLRGDIVWEDNDRPVQELWFEAEREYSDGFVCTADPFLLAGYALACFYKESRCRIEALPLCPVQMSLMPLLARAHVYVFPNAQVPRLENPGGCHASLPGDRTGAYISGGVDSLAMLHRNLTLLGKDHPERIQEGICIFGLYGFDCPEGEPDPVRESAWSELRCRMADLTGTVGVHLVPAYTNARSLVKDFREWSDTLRCSLHAAVAHAFRNRWRTVWVANSGDWYPGEWSLDCGVPNVFDSSAVAFRTDSPFRNRLARVRDLTSWPDALKVVQPCHWVDPPPEGQINCGECEKCVRTMLELLVCGKLKEAPAFPDEVTGPTIERLWLGKSALKIRYLESLIPDLREIGRLGLVRAIVRRADEFYRDRQADINEMIRIGEERKIDAELLRILRDYMDRRSYRDLEPSMNERDRWIADLRRMQEELVLCRDELRAAVGERDRWYQEVLRLGDIIQNLQSSVFFRVCRKLGLLGGKGG